MSGLYFDLRTRFPWREQLRLYRWIAVGIGGALASSQILDVAGLMLKAPLLSPAAFLRELAVPVLVILLPALGVPTLGLLLTLALWPWGRKYLARKDTAG